MYWKKRNSDSFLANNENQKSTKIIGIVGTNRGVGVTHVCIMLAEYLTMDKGSFVAILECNDHGDFKWMETNLFGKGEFPYSFHQVRYFAAVDMENLEETMKNKYAYLILDFGVQLKGKEKALSLCQKKILLGVESWWKIDAMNEKQSYFLAKSFQCLYNLSEQGIPYSPLNKGPGKKVKKILDEIVDFKFVT